MEVKIIHFWEDTKEDTKKLVEEQISSAIKRYINYVWGKKEVNVAIANKPPSELKILDDMDDGQKKLSLPSILILGVEPEFRLNEKWEDSKGYIERMKKWKYLYELFPEKIGYISVPFKPELMIIDIENNVEIYLSELETSLNNINNIKNQISNLSSFFEEAGEYFTAEDLVEKSKKVHGPKEEEKINTYRFYCQIANLIAGCIYFLKEKQPNSPEPKKVLLIDNYPERKMVTIDTRFKDILNDNITLKDILENWMNDFLEVYYYKKYFNALYQKLNEVEKEGNLIIKVNLNIEGKNPEDKNIKEFDFILVDIFLGEEEVNGIDIIKVLTGKYPSIPCFALSISDDFDIIRNAIKEGADFYILKNQIFSVLYVYYSYLKDIGKILDSFEEK